MLTLKWVCCVIAQVLAKGVTIVLAPVVCACCATPDKRHLRKPFRWMETMDWDMAGDPPWRERRLIGKNPLSWLNRTRWLWRNGAQRFTYLNLGVNMAGVTLHTTGNPRPDHPPYGLKLTIAARSERVVGFYANRMIPLLAGRGLQIQTGWKLNYVVADHCKLICSLRAPRLKP